MNYFNSKPIIVKTSTCSMAGCENKLTPENIHILVVSVYGQPLAKIYEYCCLQHLESRLANVGARGTPFESVYVIGNPKILSEREPFKMEIFLGIKEPKIEDILMKYNVK